MTSSPRNTEEHGWSDFLQSLSQRPLSERERVCVRQDNLILLPGFQNCKLLYLESVWLGEINCGSHCYGHIDVQHLRKATEDYTLPGSSHTLMHSTTSEPINACPLSLHGKTRPSSKSLVTSSVELLLPQNPILLHAHILPPPDIYYFHNSSNWNYNYPSYLHVK